MEDPLSPAMSKVCRGSSSASVTGVVRPVPRREGLEIDGVVAVGSWVVSSCACTLLPVPAGVVLNPGRPRRPGVEAQSPALAHPLLELPRGLHRSGVVARRELDGALGRDAGLEL